MIVSIAIAVLPVPRSPMISRLRWPRPIGIIESTAFMPVCIGSWTLLRWMMPGALISTCRRCAPVSALPPSIGKAHRVNDAGRAAPHRPHLDDLAGVKRDDRVALADRLVLRRAARRRRCPLRGSGPCPELFSLPPSPSNSSSFAGERSRQAVDARAMPSPAVKHAAGPGDRDLLVVVLDLLADDVADLFAVRGCPWCVLT